MSVRRIDPRAWVLVGALALGGCTSGRATDTVTPTGSATTTPTSSPTPAITTAAQFAATMHAGTDALSSARVDLTGAFGGSGAITLADGRVSAFEASGPTSSEVYAARRLLISFGAVYVRPEDLGGAAAGAWQRATTASTDPLAQQAAVAATVVYAVTDLGPLIDVLGAATSFEDTGLSMYTFGAFAPTARLSSLYGQQVVPTRIYVTLGAGGRPRSLLAQLTVDGEFRGIGVTWSGFDDPVTVTPPAAGEIAGS